MSVVNTIYLSGGSLVDIDNTLFIQLGVFLLMVALLKKLLFGPVMRLIEARAAATEGAMAAARALEEEAARLNAHVSSEIEKVRAAASVERKGLLETARGEEKELIRKAREDAHAVLTEMRRKAEKEAEQARSAIEGQIPAFASMVGKKVLGREL